MSRRTQAPSARKTIKAVGHTSEVTLNVRADTKKATAKKGEKAKEQTAKKGEKTKEQTVPPKAGNTKQQGGENRVQRRPKVVIREVEEVKVRL